MATDPIVIALIVAGLISAIAPISLIWAQWRNSKHYREEAELRRRDKEEDYARQDLVAVRAAEATEILVDVSKVLGKKLDAIQELVDFGITASMRAELNATKREIIMITKLMEIKQADHLEIHPETIVLLSATRNRVTELETALLGRLKNIDDAARERELN